MEQLVRKKVLGFGNLEKKEQERIDKFAKSAEVSLTIRVAVNPKVEDLNIGDIYNRIHKKEKEKTIVKITPTVTNERVGDKIVYELRIERERPAMTEAERKKWIEEAKRASASLFEYLKKQIQEAKPTIETIGEITRRCEKIRLDGESLLNKIEENEGYKKNSTTLDELNFYVWEKERLKKKYEAASSSERKEIERRMPELEEGIKAYNEALRTKTHEEMIRFNHSSWVAAYNTLDERYKELLENEKFAEAEKVRAQRDGVDKMLGKFQTLLERELAFKVLALDCWHGLPARFRTVEEGRKAALEIIKGMDVGKEIVEEKGLKSAEGERILSKENRKYKELAIEKERLIRELNDITQKMKDLGCGEDVIWYIKKIAEGKSTHNEMYEQRIMAAKELRELRVKYQKTFYDAEQCEKDMTALVNRAAFLLRMSSQAVEAASEIRKLAKTEFDPEKKLRMLEIADRMDSLSKTRREEIAKLTPIKGEGWRFRADFRTESRSEPGAGGVTRDYLTASVGIGADYTGIGVKFENEIRATMLASATRALGEPLSYGLQYNGRLHFRNFKFAGEYYKRVERGNPLWRSIVGGVSYAPILPPRVLGFDLAEYGVRYGEVFRRGVLAGGEEAKLQYLLGESIFKQMQRTNEFEIRLAAGPGRVPWDKYLELYEAEGTLKIFQGDSPLSVSLEYGKTVFPQWGQLKEGTSFKLGYGKDKQVWLNVWKGDIWYGPGVKYRNVNILSMSGSLKWGD